MTRSKSNEGEAKTGSENASSDQAVSQGDGEDLDVRAKTKQEEVKLAGDDTSAIRKGSIVFYQRAKEVVPAIVLAKKSGDVISLVYFSEHVPGRGVCETKVSKGLKVGQWWSDLDEIEAAIGVNSAKFQALIS